MKNLAGWTAAAAASLWTAAACAQEQAQSAAPAIEGGVSPIWAGVFGLVVLGLGVWFVVAVLRNEAKRKAAEGKSA